MKIQVDQKESCEAVVTVELDPSAVESAMQKAARRLSEKKNLPGFRKGKAPYSRILQVWGEEAILDEALDALGPEVYRRVLEEQKIEPSAAGRMHRIVSRDPLTLEFLVPTQPVVEIRDYRSVRVPYEEPAVSEEDVEKAMDELRQPQSILMPVERPAQKGDVLSADVQAGILAENGKIQPLEIDGETNPQDLELDDNLGGMFPGAGPELVGIREGETRTVSIRFPDTFPIARLKGLQAQITVRCLGVKIRKIPEWNDDLVQSVSVFATVEELREEVRKRLKMQAEESKEEEYADAVIDKMVEGANIVFPPALLEEEIDDEIQTLGRRLEQRRASLEVYLRTLPEGLDGLRKQLEPNARRKLIRRLLLTELVKREKLEPSDAAVEAKLKMYQSLYAQSPGKTKNNPSVEDTFRRLASNDVMSRLIVQRVVAIGKGSAPELPES
ncbi:MAG: trigger factor [Anaerolineales bacterium]|nr:trigger factor [Anaerolineales bacterium]